MASHREMRSEPRIDFILGSLLGDLDEWEDENEIQVQKLTESLNMDGLRKSVEKGMLRQLGNKRKKQIPITTSNNYVNSSFSLKFYLLPTQKPNETSNFKIIDRY